MIPEWAQVTAVVASPIFAAGGAYTAVRVKLDWIRTDLNKAIDELEQSKHDLLATNSRIDQLIATLALSTQRLRALLPRM